MAPAMKPKTPERQAILDRVDAQLRAMHKDWSYIRDELDVLQQHINHWQNRGIPANRHAAVAELLGWTVDRLLGKDGEDSGGSWPFQTVPPYRIERLSKADRMHVEAALIEELERLEGGRAEKYRPAATETERHNSKPSRHRKASP